MIVLCPYCGEKLSKKLLEGITSCDNCLRVFDSSSFHKILSVYWVAKKWNWCETTIQAKFNLTPEELSMVADLISHGYHYDEFFQILKTKMSA